MLSLEKAGTILLENNNVTRKQTTTRKQITLLHSSAHSLITLYKNNLDLTCTLQPVALLANLRLSGRVESDANLAWLADD